MTIRASSMSVEKALTMALKSECDAADVYQTMLNRVKNFVLKDKLKFLVTEEKKHQKVLESLIQKIFPDFKPEKEGKSLTPRLKLAIEEETPIPDLLEMSMEAEKITEEFYDELSQEVENRGTQEILQYLASMEHGHYFLLKGEYDLCIKDEAYYNREDFEFDMVHIGP